jgi:hypothetical protein
MLFLTPEAHSKRDDGVCLIKVGELCQLALELSLTLTLETISVIEKTVGVAVEKWQKKRPPVLVMPATAAPSGVVSTRAPLRQLATAPPNENVGSSSRLMEMQSASYCFHRPGDHETVKTSPAHEWSATGEYIGCGVLKHSNSDGGGGGGELVVGKIVGIAGAGSSHVWLWRADGGRSEEQIDRPTLLKLAMQYVRQEIKPFTRDRYPDPDMAGLLQLISKLPQLIDAQKSFLLHTITTAPSLMHALKSGTGVSLIADWVQDDMANDTRGYLVTEEALQALTNVDMTKATLRATGIGKIATKLKKVSKVSMMATHITNRWKELLDEGVSSVVAGALPRYPASAPPPPVPGSSLLTERQQIILLQQNPSEQQQMHALRQAHLASKLRRDPSSSKKRPRDEPAAGPQKPTYAPRRPYSPSPAARMQHLATKAFREHARPGRVSWVDTTGGGELERVHFVAVD